MEELIAKMNETMAAIQADLNKVTKPLRPE